MIFADPNYNPVTVTVTVRGGVTVASVVGDLDGMVAGLLRHRLGTVLATVSGALIVDLGRVGFCSAAILRVLLEVVANADKAGVVCAIVGEQRAVARPIELAGLEAALNPLPDVDAARDWLATGGPEPGGYRNN